MPVPLEWIVDEVNPGLNCSSERFIPTLGPRTPVLRTISRVEAWQHDTFLLTQQRALRWGMILDPCIPARTTELGPRCL